MRLATFAILLSVVVLVKASIKYCSSGEDCDDNECCIYKGLFRKNVCKELSDAGERCSHEDDNVFLRDSYHDHCPCKDDMECEPEVVIEGIFVDTKLNERCKPHPTSENPEVITTEEVTEAPETEAPETEAPETEAPETEAPEEEED